MAKSNTSSVKTIKAEKIAATGNQNKNSTKGTFSHDANQEAQVVNARKGVNLELAKKKAKKKAKMIKASKKKNKK